MTNDDIRAQLAIIRSATDTILAGLLPVTVPDQAIHVTAGGNLQAAIDLAAVSGQDVLIEPATYPGPVFLRARTSTKVLTIRPNVLQPDLGVRVAAQTSVIIAPAPGSNLGIGCDLGASGYVLQGLSVSSPGINGTMIALMNSATRIEDLPTAIAILGCWLDGGNACKVGINLGGAGLTVRDSRVFGVFKVGQDAQAIVGTQGCGPFVIENNYLSGCTETVMFGGDDPKIQGLVPSDILIRLNTLTKDVAWKATKLTVKNTLELKNAKRVLIEGNIIENSWQDGQTGFLVVFGVRNQSGTAPWSTIADVEMRYNVCRHGNQGLELLGLDDIKETGSGKPVPIGTVRPSVRMQNINIHDNLFDDLGALSYGVGSKYAVFINNGPVNAQLFHNTFRGQVTVGLALSRGGSDTPSVGFAMRDSVLPEGNYGIKADAVTEGLPSWTACVDASSSFDYMQILKGISGRKIVYPGTHNSVVTSEAPMVGSDGAAVGPNLAKIAALIPAVP